MKGPFHLAIAVFLSLIALEASYAQTPFLTKGYLDVNNIKAVHLVHGDMWNHPDSLMVGCEFPGGSGKHIGYLGTLWMSGYDALSQLHVSAQYYRNTGNDYWPGPLPAGTPISYAQSQTWAKIWKLNRTDINQFLQFAPHTVANTHPAILTWPAKGNPYAAGNNNIPLTINYDLAPFIDTDNDGVYDPLAGDYPDMKGDQMLFNVFNDLGPTHDQSNGLPLGVEIRCLAYGYNRNSIIDNVIFYEYEIIKRTPGVLDSFVVGFLADMDIGNAYDDYVGYDSSRNLGIMYNALSVDTGSGTGNYGDSIPMAAIKVLQYPGDNCNNISTSGSFIFIVNNSDAIQGNPATTTHYNNYLRGRWRNHIPLTVSDDGKTLGAPLTKYAFYGELGIATEWTECNSNNPLRDKKFVVSSKPAILVPGNIPRLCIALVSSGPTLHNGCLQGSFADIKTVSDTAQYIFCNPLPHLTSSVQSLANGSRLKIYPNPASDKVHLTMPVAANEQVRVFDALGRKVNIAFNRKGSDIEVSTGSLPAGVYYLHYSAGDKTMSGSFIKE